MAPPKRKRGPNEKSETGRSTKARKIVPTTTRDGKGLIASNLMEPKIVSPSAPEAEDDVVSLGTDSSSPSLASSEVGDADDLECDDADEDGDDSSDDSSDGSNEDDKLYSMEIL